MNPYHRYVSELARLIREGRGFPLGGFPIPPKPAIRSNAAPALIFSPHPDDECIIGGLALRLMRETAVRVINVAVTQGSNKGRQAARLAELKEACDYLGFELLQTASQGLENINVKARADGALMWQASVEIIAAILAEHRPSVIFFPHDADWNSTHIGTHYLIADALARQSPEFSCHVVETEFWGAMATPNLMVESSVTDLADMMTALSFHVGEVQRNPYHLLVPSWMQDNVRRGGELVGGQGGAAPDFVFCTLYRFRRWKDGQFQPMYAGGKSLPADVNAATLFGTSPGERARE
jgi:LmbE family N-acetylglucosaminyl deacetylase